MRIQLLYFGMLRELFGTAAEDLDVDEGAAVRDVLERLRQRPQAGGVPWAALAVAVNREYASAAVTLHADDEVALLPPVSGGLR